jgi:hypothetical protein
MAELRLDEASRKALEDRLKSPEGQGLLNRLARLIAQSAAKHMSGDLLRSLNTQEGEAAFREAWPEIVDALPFRRPPSRKAPKSARKAKGRSRIASREPRVAK